MPRALALVVLAVSVLGPTGCSRGPTTAGGPIPALSGLVGVQVRVFKISDESIRSIVPEESLRIDVENRLRSEAIPVLSGDELSRTHGEPQLWILFKAIATGPGQGYAYTVDLYLVQSVRLTRDPARIVRAITWNSKSGIGTMPDLTLERARRGLDPAWAEFIEAYRSANR